MFRFFKDLIVKCAKSYFSDTHFTDFRNTVTRLSIKDKTNRIKMANGKKQVKVIPQCCIVHPYCVRFFTSLARANESVHEHKERNFPQAKLNSEINARFLLNGHGSLCLFYCIIMVYILSSLIKKKFKILPERKKKICESAQNSSSQKRNTPQS